MWRHARCHQPLFVGNRPNRSATAALALSAPPSASVQNFYATSPFFTGQDTYLPSGRPCTG